MENIGFFIDGEIDADTVLQVMAPIAGLNTVKAAQAKCDSKRLIEKCDFANLLAKCYEENEVILFDDWSYLNSDLVASYFKKITPK